MNVFDFLLNEQGWDILRWVNALLAFGVVSILLADYVAHYDGLSRRERRSRPWIICTYVAIAYGSGEIAASPHPVSPGLRVIFITIVLVGVIFAYVTTMERQAPEAPGRH